MSLVTVPPAVAAPSGGGGGGLRQFWDCLERPQREALLSIGSDSLIDTVHCAGCRDLLASAIKNLDDDAWGKSPHGHDAPPPPSARGYVKDTRALAKKSGGFVTLPATTMLLKLLEDGVFVSEPAASDDLSAGVGSKSNALDFVHYTAPPPAGGASGHFQVLQGAYLQRAISSIDTAVGASLQTSAAAAGNGVGQQLLLKAQQAPAVVPPPPSCPYCQGKLNVRFVDTLTYPRPARKFRLLLDRSMLLGALREMMAAEAGLDSAAQLVLLYRGRPVPREKDYMTLADLDVKSNGMIAISRTLGASVEEDGADEKNKQFVGDLLFGSAATGSGGSSAGSTDTPSGGGGGGGGGADSEHSSIVTTMKVTHGCQVLGRSLHDMVAARLSRAWLADVRARASAAELLASLEAEEAAAGSRKEGQRVKNRKKKEKDKQRKLELAKKAQEEAEAREKADRERQRAARERAEAERRAKHEAAQTERAEEERRWREQQEQQRAEEAAAAAAAVRAEKKRLKKEEKRRQKEEEARAAEAAAAAEAVAAAEAAAAEAAAAAAAAKAAAAKAAAEKVAAAASAAAAAAKPPAPPAKQRQQQQQPGAKGSKSAGVAGAQMRAAPQQSTKKPSAAPAAAAAATGGNGGGGGGGGGGGKGPRGHVQHPKKAAPAAAPVMPKPASSAAAVPPAPAPPPMTTMAAAAAAATAAPSVPPPAAVSGGGMVLMPKFCTSCGQRIPVSGANFCAFCGARLLAAPPPPPAASATVLAPPAVAAAFGAVPPSQGGHVGSTAQFMGHHQLMGQLLQASELHAAAALAPGRAVSDGPAAAAGSNGAAAAAAAMPAASSSLSLPFFAQFHGAHSPHAMVPNGSPGHPAQGLSDLLLSGGGGSGGGGSGSSAVDSFLGYHQGVALGGILRGSGSPAPGPVGSQPGYAAARAKGVIGQPQQQQRSAPPANLSMFQMLREGGTGAGLGGLGGEEQGDGAAVATSAALAGDSDRGFGVIGLR
ncbi:hypothetical protein JKP88DRAFT_260827 [Tribonema minus]|uniref:Ubiquitin-like domain-containing protein n=1 Tax=Tribonema minus TaxID=303371 RepID=A0A835ZFQ4_9STRA|nr:hypothetical protein JKP88DRAFT_260827 [Tribonema minus]